MHVQEIIQLIHEQNERGIKELLQHYGPLMRYIIAPILPNKQDLEECISDVVWHVWNKIDTYDPKRSSWNTWLTALTRNAALNKLRALKSHQSAENIDDVPMELASDKPSPEEAYLQQEQKRALQEAIGNLPQRDKILIYRKYYYMQSTAQIASELSMTQRAVEGKLYRAKRKLKKALGGE